MSEFIAAMDGSGGGGYGVAEHTSKRVLAGDAEGARRRLVFALEALGYTVTSESPLQARRRALKDIVRGDFNDHARRINVSLRQSSETATVATFDFAVVYGGCWMTRGDRKTLELEADALVALATSEPASSFCRACGTENAGDARFCRLCGAPAGTHAPSEVEVLRLTAGSRAAMQELGAGMLGILLTLAVTVPLILYGNAKLVKAGWLFLAVGELVSWWMALYGLLRLYLTLNSRKRRAGLAAPEAEAAYALPRPQTGALPPASVTEGTTELLGARRPPRERVPVPRERGDTSPIN